MRSSREVRELPSYKFPEFESASRSKKIPLSFHHCVLHHQVWTVGSSRTSHDTLENSKERGLLFICVMKSLSLKPVRPAIYLEIAPPQLWCVPPAFCSRIIGRLLPVLRHQISHIGVQYIHTMDCYTVSREVSGASIDAQAR